MQQSPIAQSPHRHIPALDGLRGIAISMVLAFHLLDEYKPGNPIARPIFYLCSHFGWAGVDLFFVLSGFLITGILLNSLDDPHYFRNFYARRTLRIFPLYYGALAICFFLLPLFISFNTPHLRWLEHNQLWLWLYGSNVIDGITGTPHFKGGPIRLTHLWSLAVEEHFYLVWPTVVLLCAPRKLLGKVCVLIAVVVLIARLTAFYCGASDHTLYVFTPLRVDSLAMGGFVAVLARRPGGLQSLVMPAWVVLAGSLLFIVMMGPLCHLIHYYGDSRYFTPLALLFSSAVILATVADPNASGVQGVVARAICNPGLRLLGRYSYGLYLLQTLLQPVWDYLFAREYLIRFVRFDVAAELVHALLCFIATLVLAMISFHFYEAPFLRLKRFFESPRNANRSLANPSPTLVQALPAPV